MLKSLYMYMYFNSPNNMDSKMANFKNNIGQQTSLGHAVCLTQASNMSTVNHLEGDTTILLHRIYCYMGIERMNHFFF